MLSTITRALRRQSTAEKVPNYHSELKVLLERAKEFADCGNKHALEDLQRLVLRPIQSRHMVDAYLKEDHKAVDSFHEWNHIGLYMIPSLQKTFIDHVLEHRLDKETLPTAKLGRDIVLPTCWHPSSIMNVLGNIGEGRKSSPWEQDPNHKLHYWFPLNIFWVGGGNHSITQGIVLAEGEVKACEGYNLSKLYQHVRFDGEHWIDLHDGVKLGTPRYRELGYVYEIGRFLIDVA